MENHIFFKSSPFKIASLKHNLRSEYTSKPQCKIFFPICKFYRDNNMYSKYPSVIVCIATRPDQQEVQSGEIE